MPRLAVPEFIERTQETIRKLKVEENDYKRKKHFAAIKIQKRVRGWLTRNHIKKLNQKALTIQKNWRGHKGRLAAAVLVEDRYEKMVQDYYNKMATRIQALWRGYWTRKTHNFYNQKNWLKSVAKANEQTLMKMEEFRRNEEDRKQRELADEFEPWIHYMANKLHHFLRTKARPGIYSKLNSSEYSEIEKFLASYQYRGFMTDLRKERLMEAVRDLMTRPTVKEDVCIRGVTNRRCVATLKSKHTISNPCLNSTRK